MAIDFSSTTIDYTEALFFSSLNNHNITVCMINNIGSC